MPIEREVIVTVQDHGIWGVTCPTCPKHPHQEALGILPERCAVGVFTNAQGAVPTRTCKSYAPDSIRERDLTHFITCNE